jgi:hypothetical protein
MGEPNLILILNFLFAAFGLKGGIFCFKTITNKITPKVQSRHKLPFTYRPILTMLNRRQIHPLPIRTIFLAPYKSQLKITTVNLLFTVTGNHSDSQHSAAFIPSSTPEQL